MRKFIKNIVMLMTAFIMLISGANVYAAVESKEEKEYFASYEKNLELMKKDMKNSTTTGDATVDFLYAMIPHHETAVLMSEDVIRYGSNEEVKNKAKSIIDEQRDEISKMENLLKDLKQNIKVDIDNEKEYLKDYREAHKKMMSQMESIKTNGNVDKHFLQSMIFHHEGAIKMAESISKRTYNEEVKNMAEKMVKAQTSEINELKNLMGKIK